MTDGHHLSHSPHTATGSREVQWLFVTTLGQIKQLSFLLQVLLFWKDNSQSSQLLWFDVILFRVVGNCNIDGSCVTWNINQTRSRLGTLLCMVRICVSGGCSISSKFCQKDDTCNMLFHRVFPGYVTLCATAFIWWKPCNYTSFKLAVNF